MLKQKMSKWVAQRYTEEFPKNLRAKNMAFEKQTGGGGNIGGNLRGTGGTVPP